VQAAPGAAKCSLGMASQVEQLCVRISLLFSLTGATLCLTNYQYKKQHNTQATLACLHMRTHACNRSTSACFHALVRLCYGHKHLPKQAVIHVFMPVMRMWEDAGNPSRQIAAKMRVQECRENGVHEAPNPTW